MPSLISLRIENGTSWCVDVDALCVQIKPMALWSCCRNKIWFKYFVLLLLELRAALHYLIGQNLVGKKCLNSKLKIQRGMIRLKKPEVCSWAMLHLFIVDWYTVHQSMNHRYIIIEFGLSRKIIINLTSLQFCLTVEQDLTFTLPIFRMIAKIKTFSSRWQ